MLDQIKFFISKYKYFSLIFLILVIVIIKLLGNENHMDDDDEIANVPQFEMSYKENEREVDGKDNKDVEDEIIVDIKGAVQFPNTYIMKSTDRVKDVVIKANTLNNADLTTINLSEKLKDQMYIYIPTIGEKVPETLSSHDDYEERINLNSAEAEQLQKLPGIGPSKAQAILDYRNTNGSFKDVNELKNVKGIGEKTIESLEEYISID